MTYAWRSLADRPKNGERQFFQGSLASPSGYWATYDAEKREWVRD